MHIGIYTLFLYPGQIGGIETYVRHLLAALGRVDPANQYTIFVGEHNRQLFDPIIYPNFEKVNVSLAPAGASLLKRGLRKLKLLPSHIAQQMQAHPPDLIHYPGTTIDQPELKTPCVLTMHDIQQEYFPQFFSPEELAWRRATFRPSARQARRIITDAEYTRRSIIDTYGVAPEKITAIPLGVDDIFRPLSGQAVAAIRRKYGLPEQFFFYPANPWPHKNHARLFEALKGLRCPLVLSGILKANRGNLEALVKEAGVQEQLHILGYVPYEELPGLYNAATALVFPSLFEGFGMPTLEAMACGCPVICSDTTSLPELVGQAALSVNPLDPAQLGEAMQRVLNSPALRRELGQKGLERAKQFSWSRTARETVEVYQNALS